MAPKFRGLIALKCPTPRALVNLVCKAGVEPAVFQTRSAAAELRESNPEQAVACAYTVRLLAHKFKSPCSALVCLPSVISGASIHIRLPQRVRILLHSLC